MVFSYAFSNQVLKFNFCIWLLFLFFCHYFSKLTFVFNVGNKMTLSLSSFFFLLLELWSRTKHRFVLDQIVPKPQITAVNYSLILNLLHRKTKRRGQHFSYFIHWSLWIYFTSTKVINLPEIIPLRLAYQHIFWQLEMSLSIWMQ